MLVPTLFGLGFTATAFTTQPGPATLVLIVAYAFLNAGPLAYTLAVFMGALSASLLGKPAGWRPALDGRVLWSIAPVVLLYGGLLWSTRPGQEHWETLFLSATAILEHLLLESEVFLAKSITHCAILVLCTLLVDVGDVLQIYCCLLVVAGCWGFHHWRGTWTNLKNALYWGT